MKRAGKRFSTILWICAFFQAVSVHAEITAEQLTSVVRIFSLQQESLNCGTGFVISQDGLILTNNHVIASEKKNADHPYDYFVLQKRQKQVLIYKASFVAQDPNADLALIRSLTLKATPLQFLLPEPHETDEVYSAGFPTIADLVVLTDFLDAIFKKWQEAASSSRSFLDITDLMQKNPLWEGLVLPTVPNGKIEKVTDMPGFVGGPNSAISVVEHSCNIRGGNSGGPLLNGGGQVLGVVGDGVSIALGEHAGEKATLAIRSSQVQKFLQTNGITNCVFTSQAWILPRPIPFPQIVATAIAVAVAIAALVLGQMRIGRKTGLTTILAEWKTKGGTATELLRRLLEGQGNRPDAAAPKSTIADKWYLTGRTTGGKALQFALTEDMFARNGSRLILGRSSELCNLVINDDTVSRQHAEIRKEGSGFEVADRNSSNGTAVNGLFNQKPFEAVVLKPGDTLTLGEVKLDFR